MWMQITVGAAAALLHCHQVHGALNHGNDEPGTGRCAVAQLHRAAPCFRSPHNAFSQRLLPLQNLKAVLMDRNGVSVVVNIPSPARYAVHKLLVVGERSAAFQTKVSKDVQQAAALIDWYLAYRADELADAWADAHSRGPGWLKRLNQGLAALTRAHAPLAQRLAPYLPKYVHKAS